MGFLANLFGPKARLDDEKADQLRAEVKALSDRLGTTEIGLKRVLDDKFDPDTYRQALVVTYKEHVYGKLWKTLSAALLVIGLGFSAGAVTLIESRVDAGIQKRVRDFDELSDRMLGTYVQGLVAEMNDRRNLETSEYLIDNAEYRGVLEKLIADPLDSLSFAETAEFVAWSENGRLVDALERVAKDESADASYRGPAFKALLTLAPDNLMPMITALEDAEEGSDGYYNYLAVLATQRTSDSRAAKIVASALASGQIEAVEPALRFFAANPGQCDAACAKLVQRQAAEFGQLASIITIARAPAPLPTEAARLLKDSVVAFLETPDRTMEEKAPVAEHASIRLLWQGERELYNALYASGFRYSHAVWVDSVASLFDGFLAETRSRFSGRAVETLSDPADQDDAQTALYYIEPAYGWNGTSYEAREATFDGDIDVGAQEASIRDLRGGDFEAYLNIMTVSYFDAELWTREVQPLFPDFPATGAQGDDDTQDDLWNWVEINRDDLVWDAQGDQFTLREQ